jgi:D-tyrosyl-tRNA(Tyr) deacylase
VRALIQRVSEAQVEVDEQVVGRIGRGLLVYVAVGVGDTARQAEWLADKVAHLRIFEDDQEKLNRSVCDVRGQVLVVPNFTLLADARKGRRPAFVAAAGFDDARAVDEAFAAALRARGLTVATGRFGTHMHIRSRADGPVNIVVDTPAAP